MKPAKLQVSDLQGRVMTVPGRVGVGLALIGFTRAPRIAPPAGLYAESVLASWWLQFAFLERD